MVRHLVPRVAKDRRGANQHTPQQVVVVCLTLLGWSLFASQTSVANQPTTSAISQHSASPGATDMGESWWTNNVRGVSRNGGASLPITLQGLMVRALTHSAQIKSFNDLPLIRQTAITEAQAEFDWIKFADTFWNDTSEPVGNTLTTGGAPNYNDHNLYGNIGLRKKNVYGGEFELRQRLGHQSNNSNFFLPQDQATSQLTFSYTQPLLRGKGQVVNTSLICLAQVDAGIAQEELSRQLQSHLLEITRAYWGLYLERGNLAQQVRLYEETLSIYEDLKARQSVDSYRSQLARAAAAVAERYSQLQRAANAVKNAEARIRALVNDPELGLTAEVELLPTELPMADAPHLDLNGSVATAMQTRPEIKQAMKEIKAACIRTNVAKNDILPQLNLVAEMYLNGLRGNSNLANSFGDQFSSGAPSYITGLTYEMPIGNRAARARLTRRRLEVRRLQNQLRATMETLRMEAEVAVREVQTSHFELSTMYRSMMAAKQEKESIRQRWKLLTGADGDASLVLDNLLRSQERLTQSEFDYLNAQMTFNLSLINLKRAEGTLLQSERISQGQGCECGVPFISHDKTQLVADGVWTGETLPGMPSGEILYEAMPMPGATMPSTPGNAMMPPPTAAPVLPDAPVGMPNVSSAKPGRANVSQASHQRLASNAAAPVVRPPQKPQRAETFQDGGWTEVYAQPAK